MTTHRIRVSREGSEYEIEGDTEFIREMLDRLSLGTASAETGGTTQAKKRDATPKEDSGKSLSPGEFIRRLGVKKHTDKVAAFGYYLEIHRGVSSFTSADVNNLYYEAKIENSNTSQMITSNIQRGYVMESKSEGGGRKKYVLTHSGEEFVKSKLEASNSEQK